jgi:mycothiol synthase
MQFRAPGMADAPAVLAVLAARDIADLGVVDSALEDLGDEWRGSDVDLDRDAQVVVGADGRIVAYAIVRRRGALAVVAPDHEGQGIGSRLLEWAEKRGRETGSELHRQWVAAANASARTLLIGAGYRVARSYRRMVRSLDEVSPAPALPAGVSLRPVDLAHDAASLHALGDASFAGTPDYQPESLDEFTEEHLQAHDFDAGLSSVAERDGRIIAFLLARRWRDESVGFVDLLAVDPGERGQGLGTALLSSAFVGFAEVGLREAQLGVASDNPRALGVYERAGMKTRMQFDIYERSVASEERAAEPSASRWRAYRHVDTAQDPGSLGDELEDIAAVPFVAAEKRRSLQLLGLSPGDSVLDVGCGTGPELGPLAATVGRDGRVVGLERSGALIAQARERGRDHRGRVELVQGDARALPFDDAQFDACRADRTLQHLDRPESALAEMVRVTRPGGRVVATESRWGLVAPSLDQRLTDRVLGLVATHAEQAGWIGYRLSAMFEQAGLIDVQSTSTDYTAAEREEFFRFTRLRSAAVQAARTGALSEDQAGAWLGQLDDLVARGDAFAMVLVLHVGGTKPPARWGGTRLIPDPSELPQSE